MKINSKTTSIKLIISILVLVFAIVIIIINIRFSNRIPPGKPDSDETNRLETYELQCPLQKYLFDELSEKFTFNEYKCSANELFKDISKGEEASVEIYTQDPEQGKTEFRKWLKNNSLEESDKLRITYIHKPK